MNWYLTVLKKYAQFHGRSRRSEYWYFLLFNFIIACVLGFLDVMMGTAAPAYGIGILSALYFLAVIIPSIAVSIRRLHDTGKSGWWILINFVPFGAIVLLVFFLLDSEAGENQYGPNPKAVVKAEAATV